MRCFNRCLASCHTRLTLVCLVLLAGSLTAPPDVAAEELPLKKVTLFNAGIGFYEHAGKVSGDTAVELPFATNDLNDVLKTLVLSDPDGGAASLDYDSRSGRLAERKHHLRQAATLGDLLKGLRGEVVRCVNPTVQGRIVSVETRERQTADGSLISEEFVTLLTESGLASHPLSSFGSIQLQDPKLRAEFEKALTSERQQDQRNVRLLFRGDADREVGIGYLRQSPVWKPTHRLVLGDKPHLQTWAVVENTSEQDWEKIQLTLIGGSPISFQMAISEPQLAPRQQVALPYSGIPLAHVQESGSMLADAARGMRPFVTSIIPVIDEPQAAAEAPAGEMGKGMGMGDSRAPGEGGNIEPFGTNLSLVISQTQSVATAGEIAHYYKYALSEPLSLPAGRSAMAPVLSSAANAEKVTLYQPENTETQLFHAVILTNDTESHWAAGPLTVFLDNQYAGESQLPHCPPSARRVLTYAADLSLEASSEWSETTTTIIGYGIEGGKLLTKKRTEDAVVYQFLPRDGEGKQVLLEHPLPADGGEIVEDKAVADAHLETTESYVRYRVPIAAKRLTEFKVRHSLDLTEPTRLDGLSVRELDDLLGKELVVDGVADELKKLRAVLVQLEETMKKLKTATAKLASITASQSRVRQNMEALDRDSELYKQYVAILTQQEQEHKELSDSKGDLELQQAELKAMHAKFGPSAAPDPFADDANPFD